MYGSNRPGPYDRGNNGGMGNGAGGMGMGGGGPIRNNFNGPRGRMMRGGGSECEYGVCRVPAAAFNLNGIASSPLPQMTEATMDRGRVARATTTSTRTTTAAITTAARTRTMRTATIT